MTSNNALNNTSQENDFTVKRSVSSAGTSAILHVNHTDTTNTNSAAYVDANTLAGGGSSYMSTTHNGNQWTWGQAFNQTALFESLGPPDFGTNLRKMTSSGAQTLPRQPLFQALKSSNTTNATGDGTNVTVVFDTVVVDQASNYNSGTGLFTAPVSGNYWFYATVAGLNFSAAMTTGYLLFYKNGLGGVEYVEYSVNPFAMRELTTGALNFWGHEIIPMSAGQTMQVNFLVSGGTKTVTLAGNASPLITTRFGGWLIA